MSLSDFGAQVPLTLSALLGVLDWEFLPCSLCQCNAIPSRESRWLEMSLAEVFLLWQQWCCVTCAISLPLL